jgi:hypothetical protein
MSLSSFAHSFGAAGNRTLGMETLYLARRSARSRAGGARTGFARRATPVRITVRMSEHEERILERQHRLAAKGGPAVPSGATVGDSFRCLEFHATRTYGECLARQRAALPVVMPEHGGEAPPKEPRFPACATLCKQGTRVARHFGAKSPWSGKRGTR